MNTNALIPLREELDIWNKSGLTAQFWWRDDDAAEVCPELDMLIKVAKEHAAPVNLAVVPAKTDLALAQTLKGYGDAWVVQHGYAHVNHAPKGSGAWELGPHRPRSLVLDELKDGKVRLEQLFKSHFVPALVPPWNKMDPELLPYLPVMGYRGYSASYKKSRVPAPEGLKYADAHCDILSWENGPACFAGEAICVADLVEHLRDKRKGEADSSEPTGILTHHLEMDDKAWEFMGFLLELLMGHGGSEMLSAMAVWPAEDDA